MNETAALLLILMLTGCQTAHRSTIVDGESCEHIRVEVNREINEVRGPGG